jgi:Rrf2 family protein
MKISTRSRYGVRLMLELAVRYGGGPIFLRDIARSQAISEKYLSQIIIPLKAAGLVNSFRGAHGGYVLQRDPSRINLREIVEALEGDLVLVDCVNNPSVCDRAAGCVTQNVWGKVGRAIASTLAGVTLQGLVDDLRRKKESIVNYAI